MARTPVLLPELHAGAETVRVSAWLVDPCEAVAEGDRLVEVLIGGVTFDVSTPVAGVLTEIAKPFDAVVVSGDVLAWLDVAE